MTQLTTTRPEKRSCTACGHDWFPRKDGPPVKCPRCQVPYPQGED